MVSSAKRRKPFLTICFTTHNYKQFFLLQLNNNIFMLKILDLYPVKQRLIDPN